MGQKLKMIDIVHAECPECRGSGATLGVDLSSPGYEPPGVVNGRVARVCMRCKGQGWIHAKGDELWKTKPSHD